MAKTSSGIPSHFSQAETKRIRAIARASLDYNPDTALLTWKAAAANNKPVGSIAGSVCKIHGYVVIGVGKRQFRAHRLIWLMVHGRWPGHLLDHVNMDRSDNRLCNLREATRSENNANCRPRQRSGLKGAYWYKQQKAWYGRIAHRHLGVFATEAEAHAAYVRAAEELFGQFARPV